MKTSEQDPATLLAIADELDERATTARGLARRGGEFQSWLCAARQQEVLAAWLRKRAARNARRARGAE